MPVAGAGVKTEYDAIIVGAGPAGSTAAILLASAGWSVALIEKQDFPRRKVCGACIGATNLPLLGMLGIVDEFEQVAGPELREVALYCGDRVAHAPLPPAHSPRYQWGRALGREIFDLLLLERARTLEVSLGGAPTVGLHIYGLNDGAQLARLSDRQRLYAARVATSQDYVVSMVPWAERAAYDLRVTVR